MNEIHKKISLLYIISNDAVLMRKFNHQGYEVLDVFNVEDTDAIETGIRNKTISLFGKTFPYAYYGKIESTINKQDAVVHIDINAYRVLLNESPAILNSYADDVVKSGDQVIWLHKQEIAGETRIREGDKKILERIFKDKNIDIKIVEDQGEKWIDAKTVNYEDG